MCQREEKHTANNNNNNNKYAVVSSQALVDSRPNLEINRNSSGLLRAVPLTHF